jgi:sulfur-oxidizing protein SoxA
VTRAAALLLAALFLGCATPDARRSGRDDMGAATRAMQDDDRMNPAMLWVEDGAQLWQAQAAGASRSCAACHGAPAAMRGVAARYPAWDALSQRPVNLGTRINLCRQRHQGLPAWPPEHQELLAPPADARLQPFRERGQELFRQRIGQLDLSCAQCHDERAGGRLAASLIPQGHATGYPIYRLEWQGLGSLERRIRNCMTGVRAEPFAWGSVEMAEVELFLAARAVGMPLETPAVRP